MINKYARKKGMTLIEAIISVALLSILIIPISGLVTTSLNTSKKAEFKQRATYMGQEILEEIKLYDSVKINNRKFQLLDGYNIMEVDKNLGKFISDGDLNTPEIEELEIDGFKVEVKLERDINFKYDGVTSNGILDGKEFDFEFKLLGSTAQTSESANLGSITEDTWVLKITNDTPRKYFIYNGSGNNQVLPNTATKNTAINNNNIKIYLDEKFNKPGVTIEVQNERDDKVNKNDDEVNIFVQKNQKCTNDINVISTKGKVKIYNNIVEGNATKIGDLYNIFVKVERGGNIIFEGNTTKNMIIN